MERAYQSYSDHFVAPQFDALGSGARFLSPRYVQLQGPNIRAGRDLHVFATRHAPVSLCVNPYEGGAGYIRLGDYCIISPGARLRSAIGIEIGDSCMLAEGVLITDADWHDLYHRIYPGKRSPVRLGNNVWIGDGARLCKGVTVGDHSVVGAGAVVTRDVPSYCVAAGNPARVVRELDPEAAFSARDLLFAGPHRYPDLKRAYDQQRLHGNRLSSWLRARVWPTRSS